MSADRLAPDGIAAMIAAGGLERFVSDVIIEGSLGDATSHTSGRMTGRMTVIARVSGRRLWTVDQKLLMLRDAFGSGGGGAHGDGTARGVGRPALYVAQASDVGGTERVFCPCAFASVARAIAMLCCG